MAALLADEVVSFKIILDLKILLRIAGGAPSNACPTNSEHTKKMSAKIWRFCKSKLQESGTVY